MKQKYYVELNRQEWRFIIEALNRLRNKLIAAGRYTDAVDEMLIKVAKAKLSQSGYGDSGISAISRSIAVCAMPTC